MVAKRDSNDYAEAWENIEAGVVVFGFIVGWCVFRIHGLGEIGGIFLFEETRFPLFFGGCFLLEGIPHSLVFSRHP